MFGYENYIVNKIKGKEINWFPINRAISIPNDVDKAEVQNIPIIFLFFYFYIKKKKKKNQEISLLKKSLETKILGLEYKLSSIQECIERNF